MVGVSGNRLSMRRLRRWFRRSGLIPALLFTVVIPPAAMLVWLGARLLAQDRVLLAQREVERRDVVGQSVIRSLEQAIATAERAAATGAIGDGMLRVRMDHRAVIAEPRDRVLWLPQVAELTPAATTAFEAIETLEYQGDDAEALSRYERLAASPTPAVKAGALVRMARVHRKRREWDQALAAYRALATVNAIAIEGTPADLTARRAICSVLADAGRTSDLAREAASLRKDFEARRWLLDRPTWEVAAADVRRWSRTTETATPDRHVLSRAVEILWREHGNASSLREARRTLLVDESLVTVSAQANGAQVEALLFLPYVVQQWAAAVQHGMPERVALLTATGQTLFESAIPSTGVSTRWTASDTGLPWTVVVTSTPLSPLIAEFASRRQLLFLGLAAILVLFSGGSVVLWRVVQREMAVARQQADFVSTVSHEFRTPLTSLQHVSELLSETDDMPIERRRSFYEALARNTARLHHLVESLLDLARMDSGRKPYVFHPIDVATLAAGVAADFEQQVALRDVRIELQLPGKGLEVNADAASLASALWNLLDNAVKYSPGSGCVQVFVEQRDRAVVIGVRDRGMGIPRSEQREIFDRFVRGAQATALGIKGTGLGLAMVSHIVQAHGGSVDVESQEGSGSTFRLVLPMRA